MIKTDISMTTNMIDLRPITAADEQSMARIIRMVLAEYGANRPGFAWQDPELDYLCRAYGHQGACYFVARQAERAGINQAEGAVHGAGRLLGGAGIAPFALAEHEAKFYPTCELQKMYLLPQARGQGLGKCLLLTLIEQARALGYRYMYLESFSKMREALYLYESLGFVALSAPLGASEHNACDKWCLLEL